MPYNKHRKYWRLFYILPLTLSLFASTPTEAALTEAEQAAVWFSQDKQERALKLLKNVWLRDGKHSKQGLGSGVGYAYYLGEYAKHLKESGEDAKSEVTFQEAIDVFETVIERFPKTDAADFELAILYKDKMGDIGSAVETLENLYNRHIDKLHVRIVKDYAGVLLGVQGNGREEALRTALTILEDYTPKPEEFYDYSVIYADTLFENKLYDRATSHYKILADMKPDVIDFSLKLAKCYRKLQSYSNAETVYKELKAIDPQNGRVWFEHGILLFEMGEQNKSVDMLKQTMNIYKENDDKKGQQDVSLFLDELDWKDAKSKMSRQDFTNACPQLYDIYIRNERKQYGVDTAVCYRESKQFDVANIFFKKLIIQYPDDSNLFIEFYESLKNQKMTDDAKELLLEYVGEYGYDNPQVVSRLAAIYLGEERYQLALDTLQNGYEILGDRKVPLAFHFIAGNAHKGLNKLDYAEQSFLKAKEEAPELISAHMELFSTIQAEGNVADVQILLAEMHQQFGMTHQVRLKRAALSLMQQSWEKVLDDCNFVLNDPTLTEEDKQIIGTAKALREDATIEIAKIMFSKGQAIEAVQIFQDLFFSKQDKRNAINLAVFASKIGESSRSDTLLNNLLNSLTNQKDIDVVKKVWAEILLLEHQAPKVIEILGLSIGKDHIYHGDHSLLAVKSLVEMGRWQEVGETLKAIRAQMINDENRFKSIAERELPQQLWSVAAAYSANAEDYDTARQYWRKLDSVKTDPNLSAFIQEVIRLYIQEKNYSQAKIELDTLLLQYPDDPMVHKLFATYYQKTGDTEGWRRKMLDALTLFQNQKVESYWINKDREMNIGSVYFGLGDLVNAEIVFQKIVDEVPFYFKAHKTLGYLYLEMKDYVRAEKAFQNAITLQPNNPLVMQALTITYLKAGDPKMSKFWEDKTLQAVQGFTNVVIGLRKDSLGLFGYRLSPNLGTTFGVAQLSARPDAMVLVRESAFSDLPLAGFQIDQTVFKQNTGLFSGGTPAVWLNLTRVNSSGSLDTIVNVIDLNAHWRHSTKQTSTRDEKGILHIKPSGVLVFENEKFVQTTARIFPMGTLSLTYLPSGTNLLMETNGGYGKQRLDKYGLPTIFFHGSTSVAWGKGLDAIYGSVGGRRDKTPSGVNFSSFVTETSLQTSIGHLVPSTFIKTETLIGLPKLGNAFGYSALFKLTTKATPFQSGYVNPYSSLNISGSPQYEFDQAFQFDVGMSYQNTFDWPTQQDANWYTYPVPYSITLAFQQYWYPDSEVPMSQTLLFSFRII